MKTKTVILMIAALVLIGCTANESVRQYGGTEDIALPVGQHFVDAYWDSGDHLWYTTHPMTQGEQPTIYTMHEKSSFGAMQGTVTFRESR